MNTIMNKEGYQLIECVHLNESDLIDYQPISGSYAVVTFAGKYLICFNTWRQQWEIPAGGRGGNETSKACAIRELYEETGQAIDDMKFIGIIKVRRPNGTVKYNPIFCAELSRLLPFEVNIETDKIMLWDLIEDIGYFDEVDRAVLKWFDALKLL